MKIYIDALDMEGLWQLALADPPAVINKVSVRQLGLKRMERLHAHLSALNTVKLNENHSFELLLFNLTDKDVGSGVFSKNMRR